MTVNWKRGVSLSAANMIERAIKKYHDKHKPWPQQIDIWPMLNGMSRPTLSKYVNELIACDRIQVEKRRLKC